MGHSDENGVVSDGEVFARGTFDCVPVNKAAVRGQRGLQVLIHNHPSGNLEPSQADLAVASQVAELGQGFYIVDNEVTSVYAVVEPVIPGEKKNLDGEKLAEYISYGGSLEKISENFEEREGQIGLLKEICKVFNSDGVGIFEAGTGVGKSFAYLLPAITFALENNVRVVVSTGTINLQQQIMDKDIPLAQKILGKSIKSILIKGRQNFLCKRRLNEALNEKDLFAEEKDDLQEIANWAENSPSGSKSDMTFFPSEMAWGKVCSEADACLFLKCPHHNECFVMKMRREAASSQILVVNHHLLFADLQARVNGMGYKDAAVLPPYQHIIFDEAHDMENAATGFFSERLTKFSLTKQLSILYRTKKRSVAGHLHAVCAMSSRGGAFDEVVSSINSVKTLYEDTDKVALDLFPVEGTFRLTGDKAVIFRPLWEKMAELSKKIAGLVNILREILDDLDESYATENCVWETRKVVQRLEGISTFCKNFSKFSDGDNEVFWCERRKARNGDFYTNFVITPLDISRFMNEALFSPFDAIICT
ncbi:MAG: helicase, partial [Spirochaetaceae bacterium]|nr:helicase [Spirochaetaceae bacterium]